MKGTVKKPAKTAKPISVRLAAEIERDTRHLLNVIYEGMHATTGDGRPDHETRQKAVAHQIKLLGALVEKSTTIAELREALS